MAAHNDEIFLGVLVRVAIHLALSRPTLRIRPAYLLSCVLCGVGRAARGTFAVQSRVLPNTTAFSPEPRNARPAGAARHVRILNERSRSHAESRPRPGGPPGSM
jgi:hypothetical protein